MGVRERLASLQIQRWSLDGDWVTLREPARPGSDWGLTFPSELYGSIFDRAFPDLAKNRWRITPNNCATYFKGISDQDLDSVRRFVETIRTCVLIKDLTDGSIALGFRAHSGGGGVQRTELGQLISDAKPYNDTPDENHKKAAMELARRLGTFVASVSIYDKIDGFIAVPSSLPNPAFSLPRGFAVFLARQTGKQNLSAAVTKTHPTKALKNLAKDQKLDALIGSVAVDAAEVSGKSIVVIDDLYQSGLTINYIAEELRAAGAREVFGLAAVKTLRDDDNLPKPSPKSQWDDLSDLDLF
jgi:hypothetical protein